MNIYNIPLHFSVSEILKNFIIHNNRDSNLPYLIITPNKKTKEYCFNFIKDCENKINNNINLISISESKEILTILLNLTNKTYKKEIFNLLNTTVINKNTRNLLLSNLLKSLDGSIKLQHSINICNDLAQLLDTLETENISSLNLESITLTSAFSENILNFLNLLTPSWNRILTQLSLENIITYKTKVLNLISKIINSKEINCKIIFLSIDNYSRHSIQLFNSIANYSDGCVIFNGIDYFIPEQNWDKITYSHPQYIYKQILKKLKITRDKVKCFSKIENISNHKNINIPCNMDIYSRIFDALPYKLPTNSPSSLLDVIDNHQKLNIDNLTYIEAANEEEEAKVISNIIFDTLKINPHQIFTVVTINIDLSKRIAFNLKNNNILYDQSFGIELTRTAVCKFFTLITNIDINNVNFINLLALLKNPLSKFHNNLYYIELIDLHLARIPTPYCKLSEYFTLLNKLLSNNTINDEEYINIKNILNSLIDTFQLFNNTNGVVNFKTTLELHIKLAETLSYDDINSQVKLWDKSSGKTLKEALENIKTEAEYLPQVTLEEYNTILLDLLKLYNVRQPLNKDTKVYICGILQAQYINEKSHIIIADFNEKSFPSLPKRDIAYINTILQKLNLPTKDDSIGKEALIFNKLCYFPKVYLTRSIKQQNAISTPSRFLTKLINTFKNNDIKLKTLEFNNNRNQPHIITNNNDTKLIKANPPLKYRPKVITATAIEKLLHNPYKYFIEYVLKLECLADINTKFKNNTAGILVHEILNVFFNKYQNNLKELDVNTIHDNMLIIANHKFSIYRKKYSNALLSYHIFEYFSKDIATSIYNIAQNSVHIHSEISEKIQITYNITNNNLIIKGRADCLALNINNSTIIDFKTGNISIKKQDIKDFRKQLIILAYIFNNKYLLNTNYKVNNLEYWLIPNNLNDKFSKISISKLLDIDLKDLIVNDFVKINEILIKYLCTETEFNYNQKDIESIKEYKHFSRIDLTKM